MVQLLSKTVAIIGVGFLCFGMLLSYDIVGFSGSSAPSTTFLWIVVRSGFALAFAG